MAELAAVEAVWDENAWGKVYELLGNLVERDQDHIIFRGAVDVPCHVDINRSGDGETFCVEIYFDPEVADQFDDVFSEFRPDFIAGDGVMIRSGYASFVVGNRGVVSSYVQGNVFDFEGGDVSADYLEGLLGYAR